MFAGTEASLASTFGLAHYIAVAIWNTHEEFCLAALSSVLAVAGGVGMCTFHADAGLVIRSGQRSVGVCCEERNHAAVCR